MTVKTWGWRKPTNSPSLTFPRACEAARKLPAVLRSSKHNNICIWLRCCPGPTVPVPGCGVTWSFQPLPHFCVDHSYSGFISIRVSSPLLPSLEICPPWGHPFSRVEENKCLQVGLGREARTEAAGGHHGFGCHLTFKTEVVVEMSSLLLFLTRHFFFPFGSYNVFEFIFSSVHNSISQLPGLSL